MTPELEGLLSDLSITEVLVNSSKDIWLERNGKLESLPGLWESEIDYRQFIRTLLDLLEVDLSLHEPFCTGRVQDFRVQIVGPPVTTNPIVSIRRIRPQCLPLADWKCRTPAAAQLMRELVGDKKNLIIFGSTGSGKTTLLSSLLSEVTSNERVVILEDIEELVVPNSSSVRLTTRNDPSEVLRDISLSDLVKHSLRLRPDRLALGEVRGAEAKDLLMALATGHKGSFGTLHATSFNEALLRLEMLIQLGAPQWQTKSIRQLILLSVDTLVGVKKNAQGQREVSEIYKITGLEDFGFLSERLA